MEWQQVVPFPCRQRTRFRFSASSFCPMLAHTSVYTTSAPFTAFIASLSTAAVPTPDAFASAARERELTVTARHYGVSWRLGRILTTAANLCCHAA